jgi:uncharacterized protein
MSIFYVHGENWDTGEKKVFVYDNETSSLSVLGGEKIDLEKFSDYKGNFYKKAKQFSIDKPLGKSNSPKKLKIQLGLKCNYSCDYCSQALHASDSVDFTPKEIETFLNRLKSLDLSKVNMIEFWGGEPFVYWKTIRPLTEKLKVMIPNVKFLIITNGSLLSDDIITFLDENNFAVAISHDGPGQSIRGPDPFDDPEKREKILKLFNLLHPKGKISFNAVLHAKNYSRKAIMDFFIEKTGCETVGFGEGAVIDAYNDGGLELSFYDYQDMIKFRRTAFSELSELGRGQLSIKHNKITGFISTIVNQRNWHTLGQKCGMDSEDNLAVDMKGNVVTCQNVSANLKSFNGESHKIGTIDNIGDVKLNTGTHWSLRENCQKCPVLQLCGGSCFMLEGEHWDRSCDNSYNDNVVFFMYAIEILTGFIPYWIEGVDLPEWRKDVLGMQYPDMTRKKKSVIPIKLV